VAVIAHPERSGHPDSVLPTAEDLGGAALPPLDPGTEVGHVHLKVSDLERVEAFYRDAIGLEVQQRDERSSFLGAGGYHHHIGLNTWFSIGAPPPPPTSPGLYHAALRYPSRPALATALARLVAVGWPLEGASDHAVSEALYLRDPEGNGVELYRDRPREEWPRNPDGTYALVVDRLDVDSLFAEATGPVDIGSPGDPGIDVGHVHLQVSDTARALRFYRDTLGFDVMGQLGDQAVFLSAGGYHHHIGANTWQSRGGAAAPPASPGLFHHAIRFRTLDALVDAVRRVVGSGWPLEGVSDHGVSIAVYLRDQDQLGVELYWDRPREEWPRPPDGHGVAMIRDPVDLRGLVLGR
jgi:catechol 2,3-dioxygenase